MTNVINVMVSTSFGFGSPTTPCNTNTRMIGYVGSTPENSPTDSIDAIGPDELNMYGIGLGLLLTVIVFIPIYLLVVPCCFKNPEAPYNLDQIFDEGDSEERGSKDPVAIQNNSNVSIERGAGDNKIGGIAGILKEMSVPYHHHTFGEAFIHQLIETIEFVLGTISNTASYLRLWALSLAHGQLSEVFFNLIIQNYISIYKGVGGSGATTGGSTIPLTLIYCFFMYPCFWSVTFAVIMCMDQMECFLHCLRLHWVEMQNKFYKGDGYIYAPHHTEKVLESARGD
jgi:vacuolar-type H+-ATPase subunit I/STV1